MNRDNSGQGGSRGRRGRQLGIAAIVAMALLAVAHGAVWFVVTGRILDALPGIVAAAGTEGWVLRSDTPQRAGWPWAATVRLPGFAARRDLGGTAMAWTTERLDLVIRPDAPRELLIRPTGAGTVQFGAGTPVDVRAERAGLRVPLDGAGPLLLEIAGLQAGGTAAGVAVARVDARIEPGIVAGQIGPVVVSPPFVAPFDAGAVLGGRVLVVPPVPVAATPGRSAAAWRDAGGRVSVPELLLDWGRLRVEGSVSGGLDRALQPEGEARLRVTGALEVLDAASRAGAIQPGAVAAARAVLGLLTLAAKGGPVAIPVLLRDQVLTVAQFALVRVPVVDWDGR